MGQGGIAILPAVDPLVGGCERAQSVTRWHDGSCLRGNVPTSTANSFQPQTQLAVGRSSPTGPLM